MATQRINIIGWLLLYTVAGIIDIIQLIIGLFGAALSAVAVGAVLIAINGAADPFIGVGFIIWFKILGISMFSRLNRVISLLGVTGIEEITGGIAPFWIVDIWYIHNDVSKELAEADRQEQGGTELNIDGRREPDKESAQPLNEGGVREPKKLPEPNKPPEGDEDLPLAA
jgi:hypothetical protein